MVHWDWLLGWSWLVFVRFASGWKTKCEQSLCQGQPEIKLAFYYSSSCTLWTSSEQGIEKDFSLKKLSLIFVYLVNHFSTIVLKKAISPFSIPSESGKVAVILSATLWFWQPLLWFLRNNFCQGAVIINDRISHFLKVWYISVHQ